MHAKATVSLFCALLFGIAVLNLLAPDRAESENENRKLEQMPKFSLSALTSGYFTSHFDTYITDQFVARDRWVSAKTLTELAIGRKSSSKGVYFAADDYLPETFERVDQDAFRRNLGYAAEFARAVDEAYGVPVRTMLVPTAGGILKDKLPAFAPEVDQAALLAEAKGLLPHLVDPIPALTAHKDEYIYFRTDHHWTALGAFYAYNEWRGASDLPERAASDYRPEELTDRFYGTTWSKASLRSIPPDVITAWRAGDERLTVSYNGGESVADSVYEYSYLEKKDQYSVFLNSNQGSVHISTGNGGGRRLLVIKDSYANAFIPLAIPDFEEIFVIDPRYNRKSAQELIGREGITDVLLLYSLKGFAADQNLIYLVQPQG